MNHSKQIPTAELYLESPKKSKHSNKLINYIIKNLNTINTVAYIKPINVNSKNRDKIRSKGIQRTPALVFNGSVHIGVKNIVNVLTPRRATHDIKFASEQEQLDYFWQKNINDLDDDEPNGQRMDNREIQEKMARLMQHKPHYNGPSANRRGGEENDTNFLEAAGGREDNIAAEAGFSFSEEDGERALREYYMQNI